MREFQEKKRVKNLLYSRVTIVILFILILFFAHATWGVYKKERESAANVVRAQNELKRITDREALLNSEIARLNTEDGIEEEIRTKYGVAKPGEQVLIITETEKPTTTPIIEEKSWWQNFLGWFQ